MSSRQGGGSDANGTQNNRPWSHAGGDDTSAWPPRLPPMRSLPPLRDISQRGYDDDPLPTPPSAPSLSNQQRMPYMSTNAAIRAERIRNLHAMGRRGQQAMADGSDRSTDSWLTSRRGHDGRGSTDRHGANLLDERGYSIDDLDHSIDDLDEANSRLRALLDLTSHPSIPPRATSNDSITIEPSFVRLTFGPGFRPNELPDDSNRRNKRRKVDAERQLSNFKGFRYGKYGQLEPGQLQMEIASCDGGMYSNPYSAENILKDDEDKVYCTKGNRCNIILRHQGGTTFTLQELVIKAPASMNYSHPVREGMIFITMEQDDALNRTSQYQVQYIDEPSSQPATCPHLAAHNENNITRTNAHPFSQAFDRELRRVITQRRRRTGVPDTGSSSRRFQYPLLDSDEDDDNPMSSSIHEEHQSRRTAHRSRHSSINAVLSRRPSMPAEFSSNHPDFQITTECSDDEEDITNATHSAFSRHSGRPAPYRIGSLPFETPDSDTETNPNAISLADPQASSSSSSLLEAWEAHDRATQEAVRAVGGGQLLVPHARFFIEKHKSKCTIRFDPPVSGRFILLKMWSSHHEPGGNIDIQSVVARGFAGPRYFPSVELR